jgi:hypothetical protein
MAERRCNDQLRPLHLNALVLGQVLPGHVRNDAGQILVRKGEVFSAAHLQSLGSGGNQAVYVGPDWDQQKSIPEVDLRELLESQKRTRGVRLGQARARRYPRHPWQCQLPMIIQDRSRGPAERHEVVVETCDISEGGFGFISQRFIHPGTIVYARFDSLPERPVKKGIVRHCAHLEGRRHQVGVEFIALGANERSLFSPRKSTKPRSHNC